MKIKRFEFNMFPENCYVLWDETNEAVVIDPGCFYEEEKQTSVSYTHLFYNFLYVYVKRTIKYINTYIL